MNKFREHIEPEDEQMESQEEIRLKEPVVKERQTEQPGLLKTFLTEGVVSKETATQMLPFLLFLAFLGMVYIANSHMAVNNIRTIDKLSKQVKEMSWEYKSLKSELMFKSKLTEVKNLVDTLGIKELIEPPKKIMIAENEY
ncbi:MAG: hypothetical protein EOO01_07910 [Chitinophagaceae bacterium]|nr:MAG: hypothetical protein EOO01_07910 [Chitinophagaceae bacterium]